jgi:hypothetical protein
MTHPEAVNHFPIHDFPKAATAIHGMTESEQIDKQSFFDLRPCASEYLRGFLSSAKMGLNITYPCM